MRRTSVLICLLLSLAASAMAATISGRVVDERGSPIAGAKVEAGDATALTDAEGRFNVNGDDATTLRVSAVGYEPLTQAARGDSAIVLRRGGSYAETVTVTAVPRSARLGETPASVVVVTGDVLERSAAPTLDDVLRQVPGFSLFRRAGSRVANPTAQGVSLRGVGPSGASRALVLDDGVPLNDPFGGWVQWQRIPLLEAGRVELYRGGASDSYGSGAISGVINILPRADGTVTSVDSSWGSQSTPQVSAYSALSGKSWRGSVGGDWSRTEGYIPVPGNVRGSVDQPLASSHRSVAGKIERATDAIDIFVRGAYFDEQRQNGTPLQDNATTIRSASLGADLRSVSLRLYGSDQSYHQTFSAIADDRNSERLTRIQDVPSNSIGGSLRFSGALGTRNFAAAGAELRTVAGRSDELAIGPRGNTRIVAGGRQESSALFAQDVLQVSRAVAATASIRFDRWSNIDAFRTTDGSKTELRSRPPFRS